MTKFESIKSKNIDELAAWLDEYGAFDTAPWMYWFDENFCRCCEEDEFYDVDKDIITVCTYCEYSGKCRFFSDMDEAPHGKQIVKMWLESEN